MNSQNPNVIPEQQAMTTDSPSSGYPINVESSDTGPRTWVPRMSKEMISGVGVMAAAIMALCGGLVGYLPALSGQFPVAAAVILTVVCLPTSVYLWYIAIRRMRWEHRNGGILRRSLSGGGIVLAIFVAFMGFVLFFTE